MMLRFLSHSKQSAPAGPDPVETSPADAMAMYSGDGEVRGLSELYSPEPTSQSHVRDAADILLEMDKITDEQYGRLRRELILRDVRIKAFGIEENRVAAEASEACFKGNPRSRRTLLEKHCQSFLSHSRVYFPALHFQS